MNQLAQMGQHSAVLVCLVPEVQKGDVVVRLDVEGYEAPLSKVVSVERTWDGGVNTHVFVITYADGSTVGAYADTMAEVIR